MTPLNRQWFRTGAVIALIVAGTLLVAYLGGSLIRENRAQAEGRAEILERIEELEKQNVENVRRHRERNQADHDCIIRLALMLADPNRDRSLPVQFACPRLPSDHNDVTEGVAP